METTGEKYNARKLWEKEELTIPEACYLAGDIPIGNFYRKVKEGKIKSFYKEGFTQRYVQRIKPKDLYPYIRDLRDLYLLRLSRLKMPDDYLIEKFEQDEVSS